MAAHPSVKGFKVGDRVVYMHGATYAQFTSVPTSKTLLHIPDGVSADIAAGSVLQGLTALTLIREAAGISPGPAGPDRPWALVHAAAGGTGGLMVQILHTFGVNVIGTAGNADKCALAKKSGADFVINTQEEDVTARTKAITEGRGVDVILDGVGKATFDADLEMIARKGSIISFGNAVSSLCHDPRSFFGCVERLPVLTVLNPLVWRRATGQHSPAWTEECQVVAARVH